MRFSHLALGLALFSLAACEDTIHESNGSDAMLDAADSPTGGALVVVTNEVSGSTSVYAFGL